MGDRIVVSFQGDGAGSAALGPGRGQAPAPTTARQPTQTAAAQHAPAAQRQSGTALRYGARALRSVGPRRFGPPRQPREPRYSQVTLTSPAMYLAVYAVA